jgi:hypothetical protein
MAMIHINRSGASLGTFSEEDVREGLRTGRFIGTDLAWREGMPSWQPLSQFVEFGAAPPAPEPPPPVGATPMAAISPPIQPTTEATAARAGLPWEHRKERGFLNAFIETLQMVLSRPAEAFTVMKREGGVGEPLIYAIIGAGAGALVSFLFSLGLRSVGVFADHRNGFAALPWLGIGSAAFIVLIPVLIVLGLFIGAAIVHICLMIVGGARQSFETTFRVLAFTQGSTGPLQMVPLCGGVIAAVWGLVVNCIGLARAHEIETGRAVLAVLLPVIICCGGGILLAVLAGGIGVLSQHGAH